MAPAASGWYYAEGDPPNTVRYWDGELWIGEPQPAGSAESAPPPTTGSPLPPPAPGVAPPGMGPPPSTMYAPPTGAVGGGGFAQYTESSQATMALVLGIVGVVCCGIAAPFAFVTGRNELEGIDAGRRDPSNRGMANAGRILGIIGCVFLVLSVLYLVFGVLLAVGSS